MGLLILSCRTQLAALESPFHPLNPILQYQMAHQSPNDANSGRIRQSFRVLWHQIRKGLQSPSLQECNSSIDEIILWPKVSSVSVCRNKQTKLSTHQCRIETVCGIMELVPLEIRCWHFQLADTQPSASYNCFSEICQQG